MTDIYENNNEDDIDYSIMQFTPLPHAVGKIWLDSDSEDGEDESGLVIENWAKNDEDEEEDANQMPVVSFEEIEEIEEKEKIENSYEYKQQHLYHPPTQAEIKKFYSRNNKNTENYNNSDEYDESNFDDVNEFAILAEDDEPSMDNETTSIVFGQKQQPQQKQEEEIPKQNEIEKTHDIAIEKPLKNEDHEISIVKKNGYQNELKELKINLKENELSQCN